MLLQYLIFLTAFASLLLFFYTVLGAIFHSRQAVQIRLESISKQSSQSAENELNQPLFVRFIRPLLDSVSRTILRVTPKELVSSFEKKVVMAGNPYNLSVRDWINIQVIAVVCFPLVTIMLGYYINMEVRTMLFLSFVEIGLGLLLPNLMLSRQIAGRQKKIINSLPDVIDLLTVSVEAGLGFDGALAKVVDKTAGPLSAEFENVLQEMKVGKQKKDALRDMAERINIQDFTTFVGSIIQADQFGVSIGNVLRIQSDQMRQKRKQRAQEKAMKAPVKILIPMVLFIFPTIFAVLMGPIVLKIMGVLMNQ